MCALIVLNSPSESALESINLLAVVDVVAYCKQGKTDLARFNIDMGEGKVYKFRASSASEGEAWVNSINEWKDYFLLNTTSY
jgi:hypothetical protein